MPYKDPAQAKRWREENADKLRKQNRDRNLSIRFGLTSDEFDEALRQQGGVCAICRQPPSGNGTSGTILGVDHCHKTGRNRGLLCFKCNAGLGLFRDNPESLREAATYIERHQGD